MIQDFVDKNGIKYKGDEIVCTPYQYLLEFFGVAGRAANGLKVDPPEK